MRYSWWSLFGGGDTEIETAPIWSTTSTASRSDVEQWVNGILVENGWDYDERKRVLFMLRNRKDASPATNRKQSR